MLLGTIVVLVAISAILLAALRSLRLGLVSIVPNLLPAVMGFGVLGTDGRTGRTFAVVVVAMTIGIVVDDTVHFLAKYRRARREYGRDPEQAVHYAFETAGRALFTTTVVLVAGFLIFAFLRSFPRPRWESSRRRLSASHSSRICPCCPRCCWQSTSRPADEPRRKRPRAIISPGHTGRRVFNNPFDSFHKTVGKAKKERERLDRLLTVSTPGELALVAVTGLVLLLFVAWLLFGTVARSVTVEGVLV